MNHQPPAITLHLLILLLAPAAWGAELSITVAGMESADGQLMVAVLDSEDAYKGDGPAVFSALLAPRKGAVTIRTDALAPGFYGVRVMQDENGNGDLDTNLMGAPREPWGFSNNAVGNFGPPSWKAVRFELNGDTTISIDLNH